MKRILLWWNRSPKIRLTFWIAASAFMLFLALRDVSLQDVYVALRQADAFYVALAVFSMGVNIWAKLARWMVLLGPRGKKVGWKNTLMALMVGQTLNWFFPGRVGELSRAYVIGGMGPGRSFVLGTLGVEKVMDMLSYALLFVVLLLLLPLPAWLSDSGFTFVFLTALVTLAVAAVAARPDWFSKWFVRLTSWLPEKVHTRIIGWLRAGISSLDVLQQRSQLLAIAFLSIVVWTVAIWTNYLTALALHLSVPWTSALAVLIVLQGGISVPTIPGRFGIFQYLCILALAFYGIQQAESLSYGILLQAIVLIPATLVSLPFFSILGVRTDPMEYPQA